jgi:lysophospholipase L1-like esterase
MRKMNRVIAVILALVMVISLTAVSALADEKESAGKDIVYTCLGDSIAAGYSLPTYVARIDAGLVPVEGSYGKIVADTLKADQYNAYGTSGVRTQEMLMFLKDGYYGDAVTNYNMHYWVHTDNIDEELPVLQKKIRDGLAESNLITMGVGINDLWLTVEGILLQLGTGKPYTGPEDAQKEYMDTVSAIGLGGAMDLVQKAADTVFGVSTLVPQLLTAIGDALLNFESRYEEILQLIRKLNPNAVIVEVGYYNPFDILTPGFNGIIDTYLGSMNSFLKTMEKEYSNVYYADMTGTETIFGTTLQNDPHPTQKGHQFMADQILKVLEGKKFPPVPKASAPEPTLTPTATVTPAPTQPAEPEKTENLSDEDTVCAPYTDINRGAWYHAPVHYAIENGIMGGTGNGKFEPGIAVTRGMIAQMIYAMEGKPSASGRKQFDDVAAGKWYTNAVAFVYANRIMGGYDEKTFGPGDYVTREQLATLLRGYAQYKGRSVAHTADIGSFRDASRVSEWAVKGLEWAVGDGIIAGRNGNVLAPQERATRAEVAQMLMKFQSLKA